MGINPDSLNFKDILVDISRRIKEVPGFGLRQTVKMIVMQINMYKKEEETLKNLLSTANPGQKESIISNFKNSLSIIIDKIKRSYIDILEEDNSTPDETRNILEIIPLEKTVACLTQQCSAISKLRSTLLFVEEEKYKTREIMVNLVREKDVIFDLFDKEFDVYRSLSETLAAAGHKEHGLGDNNKDLPKLISRMIRNELILFLNKELNFQ